MPGLMELTIMVFTLSVAFAVFLIHKAIREKETGLLILALVLFVACTFLTTRYIMNDYFENHAAPPETLQQQIQESVE
jgi:thiol:disulfide interchange protein